MESPLSVHLCMFSLTKCFNSGPFSGDANIESRSSFISAMLFSIALDINCGGGGEGAKNMKLIIRKSVHLLIIRKGKRSHLYTSSIFSFFCFFLSD